jgi:archaemetzincin
MFCPYCGIKLNGGGHCLQCNLITEDIKSQLRQPSEAEKLQAIGNILLLPKRLQKILDFSNFEPISIRSIEDLLAFHLEKGQTFNDFVQSKYNRPNKFRNKIYIQPLGNFSNKQKNLLENLKEYINIRFALPTLILPIMEIDSNQILRRVNSYTNTHQALTTDIFRIIKEKRLPIDAYCVLAITTEDLYCGLLTSIFTFGQASLTERVGVYSLLRVDPKFYTNSSTENNEEILLKRSCKVAIHEIAHMFGLKHCVFFNCLMNPANYLEALDFISLHFCPICLHKLLFSIGFDPLEQYKKLSLFYKKAKLYCEVSWIEKCIELAMIE